MNLDDIMTAGSLIVNIALGVVVCRNVLGNQENGERIKVFEIMQSRGMLPTTQELDKVLIEEQRRVNQQIEAAARQKALPAPKQQAARAQRNVTKSDRGYNPDNESFTEDWDDSAPTVTQTRRMPPQNSGIRMARVTEQQRRTVRIPQGQRRQYGDTDE